MIIGKFRNKIDNKTWTLSFKMSLDKAKKLCEKLRLKPETLVELQTKP